MTMPSPGADLHIVSLDYACKFDNLPVAGGAVVFGVPDSAHWTFNFETGSSTVNGVTTITSDTSKFNQVAVEATITTALAGISTLIATMLSELGASVTVLAVEQTITIKRIWLIAPNVQGAGVSSGRIAQTDMMPYVPA